MSSGNRSKNESARGHLKALQEWYPRSSAGNDQDQKTS